MRQRCDNYELLESFTDPIKAMKYIISGDNLDIVFMDIEMPGLSEIDLGIWVFGYL